MGAATGMVFISKYPNIIQKLVVYDIIYCPPINIGAPDVFSPRVTMAREAGKIDGTIDATLERWFGRVWLDVNPDI